MTSTRRATQTDMSGVTVRVDQNGIKQWSEGGFVTKKPRR